MRELRPKTVYYHTDMGAGLDKATLKLMAEFEQLCIKGLEKKGFKFDDKESLVQFVNEHCRKETSEKTGEEVYFIDDIPFFRYQRNYGEDFSRIEEKNGKHYLIVSLGKYQYL